MPNETSELFALAAQYFLKKYKEKGGSQAILAKELGVTNAYISSVVNGSRVASFDLYTQIARKLFGPLDKFLTVGRRIKDDLPPLPEENNQKDEGEHLITRLAYYILDHQRIAKEIKELKQFYESIVENLQSSVLVMDNENEVVYANNKIMNICGIPPSEIVGKSPLTFKESIPGLKLDEFVRKYNEAFEQLKPLYYNNIRIKTLVGVSHYISGWMIPLFKDDRYNGMICTLRDTSDGFAVSNLLIESIDHIQDAVVILQQINPGERPIAFFANKKFRKIFNLDNNDPFSNPFQKLVCTIKENIVNKEEWEEFIAAAIRDNKSSTQFTFALLNGDKYLAEGKPIHDRFSVQIGRMAILKKTT